MSDLIRRSVLIDEICRSSIYKWSVEEDQAAHNWALNIINSQPSVESSKGDLISRADAIEAVKDTILKRFNLADWYEEMLNCGVEIEDRINALPSADAVQGEWKQEYRKTANGVDFCVIACSECDYYDAQMHYYNYCPSCGARMKGGAE